MPTVIDSVIITLGLDPTNFDKNRKKVAEDFVKTKGEAERAGKAIEGSGSRGANFFRSLRTQALALFAAFAGARAIGGLVEFGKQLNNMDANLLKVSRRSGQGVEVISKWQNALRLSNNTVEDVSQTMEAFQQSYEQFMASGGVKGYEFWGALKVLGVNIAQLGSGKLEDFTTAMLAVSKASETLGAPKATYFLRNMGISDGMIDLLVRGREEVERLLKKGEALGVATNETAEQSAKLVEQWEAMLISAERLGRAIKANLTPALSEFYKTAEDGLQDRAKRFEHGGWAELFQFFSGAGTTPEEHKRTLPGLFNQVPGLLEYMQNNILRRDEWGIPYENPEITGPTLRSANSGLGYSMSDYTIKYLMNNGGLTEEQAIGVAANIGRESSGNLDAKNGSHFGLAQWDKGRQELFGRLYGHDMNSKFTTYDNQLDFLLWELAHTEKAAGDDLRLQTTRDGAAYVFSKEFERPNNGEAEASLRALGALGMSLPNSPHTNANRQVINSEVNIGTMNVNAPYATDADGIAKDARAAFTKNPLISGRLSSQANTGAQ